MPLEEPGLRVLPENPDTLAVRRESLGVVEIPSELIDGTCNDLRKNAFSRGFYPVLQEESEFAHKWSNLCKAHLEEGIRDPIKAVEYLNHFYVVEGHKRVSVLKYFGAISIPGVVTRLLPKPSDDPEVVAYYEFLPDDRVEFCGLQAAGGVPGAAPGSGPHQPGGVECGRNLCLPLLLLYVPGCLLPG